MLQFRFAGLCWAVLTLLFLSAMALLVIQLADEAPKGRFAEPVVLTAADGVMDGETPVSLGQLGRPAASYPEDMPALIFRRTIDKGWEMAAAGQGPSVLVRGRDGRFGQLDHWPIAPGDRIRAAGLNLAVTEASKERLELRDETSGRRLVWSVGGIETPDEQRYFTCRIGDAPWPAALRSAMEGLRQRLTPNPGMLFTLGGTVTCPTGWAMPGLMPHALDVRLEDGRYWLSRRRLKDAVQVGPAARYEPGEAAFHDVADPHRPIDTLKIGRTLYRVDAGSERLVLTAVAGRAHLPPDGDSDGDAAASLVERPGSLRTMAADVQPAWAAVAGMIWVGLVVAGMRFLREPPSAMAAMALAVLLVLAVSLVLVAALGSEADALSVTTVAGAAWAGATLVMALGRRLDGWAGPVWCASTLLAGSGLIIQLQIAAGSANEYWVDAGRHHAAGLAVVAMAVVTAAAVPATVWQRLLDGMIMAREGLWPWLRRALAAGMVAVLLIQLAFGSERGLWGVQPAEPAKTLMVLILAYLAAWYLYLVERSASGTRWSAAGSWFATVAGCSVLPVVVLLALVRDFSPVLLLGIVGLVWITVLAVRVVEIRRYDPGITLFWMVPPILLAALGLVAGGVAAAIGGDGEAWTELTESLANSDRLMVWIAPDSHPVSGEQVLRAYNAIAAAIGHWNLLEGLGRNGVEMNIPVVQTDFAGAFLLARFGWPAGAALLLVQVVWLAAALAAVRSPALSLADQWPVPDQRISPFLAFAGTGLVAAQAVHWLVGWSNPLGLLPVMGQPMTWVATGTSHLLGFALPTLLLFLIAAWIGVRSAEEQ